MKSKNFDLDEFRKEWIVALRSGEYKQGRGYLHQEDRFCCLGVACDLLVKRGLVTEKRDVGEVTYYGIPDSTSQGSYLPIGIRDLLKIPHQSAIAGLNDDVKSFDYIAKALEAGEYWDE